MEPARSNTKAKWFGRVLSWLPMPLFLFSAAMKFKIPPEAVAGMEHLGIPMSMVTALGILEITCVVLYVIPATALLGAILLTGYIGGAIFAHWRVGDNFVMHIIIGVMIWGGLYLRDARLKELLPLRRNLRK